MPLRFLAGLFLVSWLLLTGGPGRGLRAGATPEIDPEQWRLALQAPESSPHLLFRAWAGWTPRANPPADGSAAAGPAPRAKGSEEGGSGLIRITGRRSGSSVNYSVETEDRQIDIVRSGSQGVIRYRPRLGDWREIQPHSSDLPPDLRLWWNDSGHPDNWGRPAGLAEVGRWATGVSSSSGRRILSLTLDPDGLAALLGGQEPGDWRGQAIAQFEPIPRLLALVLEFRPQAPENPIIRSEFTFSYDEASPDSVSSSFYSKEPKHR